MLAPAFRSSFRHRWLVFFNLPMRARIVLTIDPALQLLHQAIGHIPISTTDLFLRSSDATILYLNELRVFYFEARADGSPVRWPGPWTGRKHARTYDLMCQLVAEFDSSWRTYFFVVEFATIPSAVLCLFGYSTLACVPSAPLAG